MSLTALNQLWLGLHGGRLQSVINAVAWIVFGFDYRPHRWRCCDAERVKFSRCFSVSAFRVMHYPAGSYLDQFVRVADLPGHWFLRSSTSQTFYSCFKSQHTALQLLAVVRFRALHPLSGTLYHWKSSYRVQYLSVVDGWSHTCSRNLSLTSFCYCSTSLTSLSWSVENFSNLSKAKISDWNCHWSFLEAHY